MSTLKVSYRRSLIILTLITFCVIVLYVSTGSREFSDVDQKARISQIEETIRKYANSAACIQPHLPLNSPEIASFIKHCDPIDCSSAGMDWVKCNGSECYIRDEIKIQKGMVKCSFTDVIREDDFRLSDGGTTHSDSHYKLEHSDLVYVKCTSEDNQKWSSVLTGIRSNKNILERSGWQHVPDGGFKLNVLMLGFDSLSRNTFMRKLPKSYQYLVKELGGLVLEGYNIVGDGTPQALTPILTGKTELELPDVRKRFTQTKDVDVYPFVWKNYQDKGYVTAFFEDLPQTGIYQYRLRGFKNAPTDHYMRPYYLSVVKDLRRWPRLCVGETPRHKIMLNQIEQFFSVYKEKPKFLFGFHGELSHDDYNLIGVADDDLFQFLNSIRRNGVLDDTVLILMADHGHRFAEIRNTLQGKQEERLPFFSFRFPDRFKTEHKPLYDNFVSNLKTLTTPFDIHSTLEDILDFGSPDVADISRRSVSLFSKIPKQRSCVHAHIEPHWCACVDWERLPLDSEIVGQLSDVFARTVNEFTREHRDACAPLRVAFVDWAIMMRPNGQLVKFRKNADIDGFVADLSANTHIEKHTYQIKLMTSPGDSLFEATVTHHLDVGRFELKLSDISRINKYGAQARCIENTYPELRKYCYCMVD